MDPLIPGFGLVFFSAVAGGAFALPLRLRKRFEVENTMLVAFAFATLIFPLIFVSIFVPTWTEALGMVEGGTILEVMIWGACWGMGGVFMALGVASIGMSIPYATVMGISTVVGSMIPLSRRWADTPENVIAWTLIGVVITIVGVILCGRGGYIREKEKGVDTPEGLKNVKIFVIGLIFCIVSGFLSAGANIGFDTGKPIARNATNLIVQSELSEKGITFDGFASGKPVDAAIQDILATDEFDYAKIAAGELEDDTTIVKMEQKLAEEVIGYRKELCSLSAWMPMWWGGYLAMVFVFGTKLMKNKTLKNYRGEGAGRDLMLAVSMGLLHYLAQAPYGVGAFFLGNLGTTIGWVLTIASSLIVANLLGALTGEWKGATQKSKGTLITGLVILIGAMICLAYANHLQMVADAVA